HAYASSRTSSLFTHSTPPPPAPHSFPSRRSSDLAVSAPRPSASAASSARSKSKSGVPYRSVPGTCDRPPEAISATRSARASRIRSEEHTSELQLQSNLVCRLLLEKKKKNQRKRKQ